MTITRWLFALPKQRSRTRNHTTHGDVTLVSSKSEQNGSRLHTLAGDQKGTRIMQIMQRLT